MDPWWTTSDFRAYWYPNCPVSTSAPTQVLSSVFIKPEEKKALVIFANWSYDKQSVQWMIDTGKLGFKVKNISEIDTVTCEPRPVEIDKLMMTLEPRDFAIVELRGE